ncbi:MAG: apolipoprotein N-acyltransferase [Phycisphaerales bacterium]|nr:apolipoprotein N-acyltransferase [Phycisphaerales bacterium]
MAPTRATIELQSFSWASLWGFAALPSLCLVAAFPPFDVWWMTFATPIGWIVLSRSARFGLREFIAVFVSSLAMWLWFQWWMREVTSVGYPAACLYLALYAPMVVWWLRLTAQRGLMSSVGQSIPAALSAPIALTATEWLRGEVVFDGYPWYGIGQPLINSPALAQIADLGGAPLCTTMVAIVAGGAVDVWRWREGTRSPHALRRATVGGTLALSTIALAAIYGSWRLNERNGCLLDGPRILAVQTNLATDNKIGWPRERQEADLLEFSRMSIALADASLEQGERIDLVVWPETMLPGFGLEPATISTLVQGGYWPGDRFASLAKAIATRIGAPFLVGSPAFIGLREVDGRWSWKHQFNSAYLVHGEPPYARYDKVFLTPFGETMPYISKWAWLEERCLALGARGMTFDLDASAEFRRITLVWKDAEDRSRSLECATPICFEDTVGSVVRHLVHDRDGMKQAQILVNLSNDGWFGASDWGRAQHAIIARWRCIENRVPMVRVANTGISQSIGSDGAVIAGEEVAARVAGGFTTRVQLDRRMTVFGHFGDVLSPVMALLALALLAMAMASGDFVRAFSRRMISVASRREGIVRSLMVCLLVCGFHGMAGCNSSAPTVTDQVQPGWSSRTAKPSESGIAQTPQTERSQQQSQQQAMPQQATSPPISVDPSEPPQEHALRILVGASQSGEAIYRAHALEGLKSRPEELQPIACRLLGDPNPGVRFAAAVVVGEKTLSGCADLVEPLLLDPNPSVRAGALFALVRLGRQVDLSPFADLVMSPSADVRANSIFLLGELRNASAIGLVESVVGRRLEGADQIRSRLIDLQAAEAMVKMGDVRQLDPIRAALFSPLEQSEFVAIACQMIGEINDRGARPHLIGIWNGQGPLERPLEIRLIAGEALIRIGEPNLEPIFQLCQTAVVDPSPAIRGQAVATLGWAGGQRACSAIAPLLSDPVPIVRLTAAAAYLRASGNLHTGPR